MSYRIARSDADEFTLAPAAFASALEAARRHGVTHVWLGAPPPMHAGSLRRGRPSHAHPSYAIASRACASDAWAYRKQPPWEAYHHDDFVKTLATVMAQVDLVIWLPRSRKDAPGQCTVQRRARAPRPLSL